MKDNRKKDRTLFKDFLREIGGSLNRYLSILLIVMLGVAFYAGVRSAQPDMQLSADTLYDEKNMMDIRVLGTLGLTENDLDAIRAVEGVTNAQGGYVAYEMTEAADGKQSVVSVQSLCEGMNNVAVKEGRLPEKPDECFVDETYAQSAGLKLGDTITLHEDDESKDIADTLVTDTFTVVGSGSYAWYLNFDRGTADIGNGDVRFFLMVPPESFALEAYTVIYATTDGADGMICYDQDYKDYVGGIEDRIELLEDARCRARYDEVQQEGADKIADAKQQIADGEKELQDAKDKLADAKVQLDDAAQTIADGEKEIEDGKKELSDAKREIRKRQKEIDDGWAELNEAKEQLSDAADQIRSAGSQLSSGQAQLSAGRAKLNDQKQQFAQMEQQAGQLKDPAAYQAAKGNYEQLKAAEQAGSPLTEEQQAALGFYGQVLPGVDAALGGETNPSGEQLSQAVESALQPSRDALSAADQKLNASESQLASGRRQLESAQEEYDAGAAEIAENEQKLIDGQQQIDDAQKEIRKNERKLKDAEEELADGRKEYEDAKQEFDDAQAEFDEKSVSAQADIDEAKQKVADAEEELADLSVPEWYVLDRESIQSYVEYGMDTDRIGAIGQVFPAIFFLVAALVSLTTMTRMVEEERLQIGTMKALGYTQSAIAAKYIGYALSASVLGGVLGILLGSRVLPYIIQSAYNILYVNMSVLVTPIQWGLSAAAMAIAVLCTVLATYAACYAEFRAAPAELMRPAAPAQGKRVLLERVTFLWKRMSFSQKATFRNLFRYKKRFFMTIFGIGACMGLLLVAFGLRNSISEIVDKQYTTVWTYDTSVSVDSDHPEKLQKVEQTLDETAGVAEHLTVKQNNIDAENAGVTKSVYLFVPEETDNLDDFVRLNSRTTKAHYELDDEGVIITEKLARLLDVKAGGEITLKHDETEAKTVKVAAVAENYLYHYVYMTPALYQKTFGEAPDYSAVFLRTDNTDEEALGRTLLSIDGVTGVSFVSDLQSQVANMMKSLDMVVLVLVISAGMLAFIVLYNLNNISIIERRRELATLKVLGFYDSEVAGYVYRENVWLTCIGMALGMGIGFFLHKFIIRTCEVDMIMFGQNIRFMSYVWSMLLTLLFAVIVNFLMFWKLKKIDMVESLKSIE